MSNAIGNSAGMPSDGVGNGGAASLMRAQGPGMLDSMHRDACITAYTAEYSQIKT